MRFPLSPVPDETGFLEVSNLSTRKLERPITHCFVQVCDRLIPSMLKLQFQSKHKCCLCLRSGVFHHRRDIRGLAMAEPTAASLRLRQTMGGYPTASLPDRKST